MRILRDDRNSTLFLEADSISETVDKASIWNKQPQAASARVDFDRGHWNGRELRGWEDVRTKLHEPWAEGMARFESFRQQFANIELPAPKNRKRRRGFNEEAGDVEVDRLMGGQLDYFSDPLRREVEQPKVVSLFVPLGFHAGIKADAITWTSVAVAVATDILEAAGRQVEISFGFMSVNSYGYDGCRTMGFVAPIKAASDPVNISSLVNVLSPWYYRTIGFGMMDSQPDLKTTSGRGQPVDVSDRKWNLMLETIGIPENTQEIRVPHILEARTAEQWLGKIIAEAQSE